MATTTEQTTIGRGVSGRILQEGYGPGAWHGADLKAALADVTPQTAFRRPGAGRHNIAEIALHHAFCARAVRGQISGAPLEAFVLEGEDWFALDGERTLSWPRVQAIVDEEQRRLTELVADVEARRQTSPIDETERFKLVLGITCHAVYHAGQVQLVKKLLER